MLKDSTTPIWWGVIPLILNFVGRQPFIEEIDDSLKKKNVTIVAGPAGIGKTTLVIKFAHHYRTKYTGNVVWLNASSYDTIKDSVHRLCKNSLDIFKDAQKKEPEYLMEEVYKFFLNKKCLFIFDDADLYNSIVEFLPANNIESYDVLITSKKFDLASWNSDIYKINIVHLTIFNRSETIEFLKKFLDINDHSQDAELDSVADYFMDYPLAINRVANGYRIMKNNFEKRRMKLPIMDYVLNNFCDTNSIKAIADKMLKSMHNIEGEKYGKEALKLFDLLSYLAPKAVPILLFVEEVANNDNALLLEIVQLLSKHSLIILHSTDAAHLHSTALPTEISKVSIDTSIDLHKLFQKINRDKLKEIERELLHKILSLLKNFTEREEDDIILQSFRPHVESAWNYASSYPDLVKEFITDSVIGKHPHTSFFHLIGDVRIIQRIAKHIPTRYLSQVINIKTKHLKKSPLHYAVEQNEIDTVSYLIENKANLDSRNKLNHTPLHLALKHKQLEIAEKLMKAGPKVNVATSKDFRFTPLHFAAGEGDCTSLKMLLAGGADVDSITTYGFTPLHIACKKGNLDAVKLLVNEGNANISARTKYGYTPLHLAANGGYVALVKFLLNARADPNIKNNSGFTPMHEAAINNKSEVVRLLKEKTDTSAQTTMGKTPLDLAKEKNYVNVVSILSVSN